MNTLRHFAFSISCLLLSCPELLATDSQNSASAAFRTGSFAQLAWGTFDASGQRGYWKTSMLFLNIGTVAEQVTVHAHSTTGQPLPIPIAGGAFAADHQFMVPAGGSIQLDLDELAGPLSVGWAEVVSGLNIRGQGIYTQVVPGRPTSQAVVPLVVRDPSRCVLPLPGDTSGNPDVLIMPFDNIQYSTSYAFANTSDTPRTLSLKFIDATGSAMFSLQQILQGRSHVAFDTSQYPELRSRKGQVVVQNEAAVWTAIGFLFNGTQNTFTTTLPIIR